MYSLAKFKIMYLNNLTSVMNKNMSNHLKNMVQIYFFAWF